MSRSAVPLRPREELTIRTYVEGAATGMTQVQAWLKYYAGYDDARMNRKKAEQFFDRPKVHARVRELMDATVAQTTITAAATLQQIAEIAFSDIGQVFNERGMLRAVKDMPLAARRAISSVKVVESATAAYNPDTGEVEQVPLYTKEVKFWDKNSSLEKLAKYLGLFEADNLQRSGFAHEFERMTPEVRDEVRAKLRAIVDGQSDAGAGTRTTH